MDWIAPEVRFLGDHLKETLAVDSEGDETITFLMHLIIAFPTCATNPVSVSQVAERGFPKFEKSTLRAFVSDGLIGGTGSSFAKRLGRWLKKVSTRRWGNIELIPVEDKHDGVWKYRIGRTSRRNRKWTDYLRRPRRLDCRRRFRRRAEYPPCARFTLNSADLHRRHNKVSFPASRTAYTPPPARSPSHKATRCPKSPSGSVFSRCCP